MKGNPENARVNADKAVHDEMVYVFRELSEEFHDHPIIQSKLASFSRMLTELNYACDKNAILVDKCVHFNEELMQKAQTVKDIIYQIKDDKEVIDKLKQEFERVSKRMERFEAKDKYNQSIVSDLKSNFEVTYNISNQKIQEDMKNEEQRKENQSIKDEIEENKNKIKEIQEQIKNANSVYNALKQEVKEVSDTINSLNKEINDATNLQQEMNQENLESFPKMKTLSATIEESEAHLDELFQTVKNYKIDPELNKQLSILNIQKQSAQSEAQYHVTSISIRKNRLELIRKKNAETEAYVTRIKNKIQKHDNSLEKYRTELNGQLKIRSQIEPKYQEVEGIRQNLKAEKNKIKKQSKELMKNVVSLGFQNVKVNNDKKTDERHIVTEKMVMQAIEKDMVTENFKAKEIQNQSSILMSESMACRVDAQDMKETASRLLVEINNIQTEEHKAKMQLRSMVQETQNLNEQCEAASQTLQDIKNNTAKQSQIVERLRQEKIAFEKMVESATAETDVLQRQFNELIVNIRAMTERIDHLIAMSCKYHEASRVIKEANVVIQEMNEQTREGFKSSEKINQQLVNDAVKLQSLLEKSAWDFRQQKKEFVMLNNSYQIVVQQCREKGAKIETLRSEIKSLNTMLQKSKQQYLNKIDELKKLEKDYNYYMDINDSLIDLNNYTVELKEKDKKLSEALQGQRLRRTNIVEELKVPRNVHRYTVMAATKPELAKQYKYLWYLRQRYVETLVALDKVKQQKNDLEEKLKRKEQIEECVNLTSQEVMDRIKVYEDAIREKDRQLAEMNLEIRGNSVDIDQEDYNCSSARNQLMKTKEAAATMRARNMKIQMSESEDEPYFITEPSSACVTTFGGGFTPRLPESARDSKRFTGRNLNPKEVENIDFSNPMLRGQRALLYMPNMRRSTRNMTNGKRMKSPPHTARVIRQSIVI